MVKDSSKELQVHLQILPRLLLNETRMFYGCN